MAGMDDPRVDVDQSPHARRSVGATGAGEIEEHRPVVKRVAAERRPGRALERTNESGRVAGGMEQRDGAAAEVDLGAVLDKFAWPRGRDRVAGKVVVRRGKAAERLGRQPALPLRRL